MYIEEISALMRLAGGGEAVVAKLAQAALSMVESLQDAKTRAELAEALLEAEQAKLAAIRDAVAQAAGGDSRLAAELAGILG